MWQITGFTIACALGATLLVLPPGVVVAWLLARYRFPGRAALETLVSMPLVLPPVATGLILLLLLSRRGPLGGVLARFGIEIVFTWKAVVIAMAVMGFPLLVRTALAGFEQVNVRYERVAATLGARPFRIFLTISLPLAWPSVLAGGVLAFARALGEFGATVMVFGSVGGSRTLSISIYNDYNFGEMSHAWPAVIALSAISLAVIVIYNRVGASRSIH